MIFISLLSCVCGFNCPKIINVMWLSTRIHKAHQLLDQILETAAPTLRMCVWTFCNKYTEGNMELWWQNALVSESIKNMCDAFFKWQSSVKRTEVITHTNSSTHFTHVMLYDFTIIDWLVLCSCGLEKAEITSIDSKLVYLIWEHSNDLFLYCNLYLVVVLNLYLYFCFCVNKNIWSFINL